MHNIKYDLQKQVQARRASPLRDRLADAVELMIKSADEVVVAHSGFLLQPRPPPVAFSVSSIKLITERASTTTQVLHDFHGPHDDAQSHWGLNE